MKKGFTLAEALITILIIGVVAALVMPSLISTFSSKIKASKIESVEKKFRQGTDLLGIQNGIGPYYENTISFVNELSKYMKIISVCNPNELNNCFKYDKIKKRDGSLVDVSDLDLRTNLRIAINYGTKDYAETIGVVLGDGTPMLLAFDKNCEVMDPDSRSDNSSSCIAGVFDINGPKGPNKIGADIISFNTGCAYDVGDMCFSRVFPVSPINVSQCSQLGELHCIYSQDYFAGAVKACGGLKNMPSIEDLELLYNSVGNGKVLNPDAKNALNISSFPLYVWGNKEYDLTEDLLRTKTAALRIKMTNTTVVPGGTTFGEGYHIKSANTPVICLSD